MRRFVQGQFVSAVYLCKVTQKVKNTIPVYDICSLSGHNHVHHELIAEPFGSYLKVHPNLHAPHRHSFYHMLFLTRGAGYHTIDFEQFDVKAGQIYFMIPGQVHSWNFEGVTDGFIINFSEELFRPFLSNDQYLERYKFFRGVARDSVYQLSGESFREVKKILEKIMLEAGSAGTFAKDLIRACLIELFVTVHRMGDDKITGLPAQNQLILHNFRKLVDTYYAEKRLPKDYAAMLYITPNHLNALCNEQLGRQAGEVIRDRILLEAKRLLINADENISATASRLKFSDNSHFTKFFKKYTHLTPEEFRKTSGGAKN